MEPVRVPTATKTSNPLDVGVFEQVSTHGLVVLCLFKPHGLLYALTISNVTK
jgi:hypothetical protein